MKNKLIVISGQTGVGKTTFLKKIKKLNVVYMDDVVKDIFYRSNTKIFKEVEEEFGPLRILNGKIDTSYLGKIVLGNQQKLEKLSRIVNKYIKAYLLKLKRNKSAIIEMAIYSKYEEYFKDIFDYRVVVVRSENDLSNKFTYMDNKKALIDNEAKEFDLKINLDEYVDITEYQKVFEKVLL